MENKRAIVPAAVIIFALLGAVCLAAGSVSVPATTPLQETSVVSPPSGPAPAVRAFYFYGDGCVHCANVRPYLLALAGRYPNLDLVQLEVYHNTTNQNLFARFQLAYGIHDTGVPTLFIGDRALIGESEIRDKAESVLLRLSQNAPLLVPAITPVASGGGCPAAPSDLTLALVVTCAIIDSVNPCAFAVLVFLLLSIITLESRGRVLAVGGAYIAAVYLFYLLSGIGLFSIIQHLGVSQILFYGAALLAIILGLVNIVDVIRKDEGFILAIPSSKKEVIERYIRAASLPGAFLLGILVGIFELPCTGGIYLAILGMMSRTFTFDEGLPYLLLYNFIFVLPLIAILLVVAFGLSPETVNSWRVENRRILRFCIGLVMIAIGMVMLSGWI